MKINLCDFEFEKEILDSEEQSLVFDQELILTETTKKNLKKIIYPILENRNVLLIGDAGIGKNALVYYLNKRRNLPTIRFSFNQDTLPEDLVGSFRILPDGFHWQDGPLVTAMKKGYTFVADEMNLASPEILKRFISVFEKRSLSLLEKDGGEIFAHERFRFIATQNPTRGFEGRKILPESIQRLFTTIYLNAYSQEEETQIIKGLFEKIPTSAIENIVELQRRLEKDVWENIIAKDMLEHYHFNIRTEQRFFNRMYPFFVKDNSFEKSSSFLQILFRNLFAFYVDIFIKENDKNKVLLIIAEIFDFEEDVLKELYEEYNNSIYLDYARQLSSTQRSGQATEISFEENNFQLDVFPVTKNRSKSILKILESLEHGENLLLEGDDDVRIHPLVFELAQKKNQKIRTIYFAKGMHTSEIIGALRPIIEKNKSNQKKSNSKVKWIDGPLVEGLKNQEWIILDNIEAAGSELIEKLNMLLDHASALAMPPEADDSIVLKSGKARIIAVKRTRKSRSQGTISRAFRNRFFNLHIQTVNDLEELKESLFLFWSNAFDFEEEQQEKLLDKMLYFHDRIIKAVDNNKIASTMAEKVKFREENLLRWSSHILQWLDKQSLDEVLKTGVEIHYLMSLPNEQDRLFAQNLWRRIAEELPIEEWHNRKVLKKKLLLKNKKLNHLKIDWDVQKYFREANTGEAKTFSGENLKKGIRINTPETGGDVKEGEDAWYGKDTIGNKGRGEPAGGGGAWGYRTEALFQQFLEKYKPKFDYSMGLELKDYYDTFGVMLNKIKMDLENALDSDMHIERQVSTFGNRVEPRRYLAYMANKGSDKIFDRSKIIHTDDKLKGLEFSFYLNKGRRLFNFSNAVAAVVSLQSSIEILWNKKVPVTVYGYSDFLNKKQNIDLVEYSEGLFSENITLENKEFIFENMVNNWDGDTIEEYQILNEIANSFSTEASTKIAVIVSDFRGHRAKEKIENSVLSFENQKLKEIIKEYSKQNYIFLGVQIGNRNIAEHLFEHSISIHGENFSNAPIVLSETIKNLIVKYHKVVV